MREPLIEGADEEDQPTWNIWEYDVPARALRRVIPSDIIAEEGHDVAPHYLPDGRIVFASTRQRQSRAILLDEGKPQFEAQDEDRQRARLRAARDERRRQRHPPDLLQPESRPRPGGARRRTHRLQPLGQRRPQSEIHLYAVRPDGSGLELLYGAQSHMTGTDGTEVQFLDPRPMANGELLVRAQPFTAVDFGGQLLAIDTSNYVENTQTNLAEQRRARRPRAEARDAEPGRDDSGTLARRPLQLGVSRCATAPVACS